MMPASLAASNIARMESMVLALGIAAFISATTQKYVLAISLILLCSLIHFNGIYFGLPIILAMVINRKMLILILSGTNLNEDVSDVATDKDATKITGDIFLIIFICILVFLLSIALIPNFKELKDLFEQIGSVTYVLVYTIFLIFQNENI